MSVLTLDRNSIRTYAARRNVQVAFPFLAAYAKVQSPGCCGGSSPPINGTPALRQIASLPKDRQEELKRLLGVSTIRLRIVEAGRSKSVEI